LVSSTVAAMSEMRAEPPERPGPRPGGRSPFHIECRPATHTSRASNTPQRSGRSTNETTPILRCPRELGSEGIGAGLDNARRARRESARPPSDRPLPLAVVVDLLPAHLRDPREPRRRPPRDRRGGDQRRSRCSTRAETALSVRGGSPIAGSGTRERAADEMGPRGGRADRFRSRRSARRPLFPMVGGRVVAQVPYRKPLQMWAGVDASESGASLMARKQSSLPAESGQPAEGSHW
jgi:hypothetical protein